ERAPRGVERVGGRLRARRVALGVELGEEPAERRLALEELGPDERRLLEGALLGVAPAVALAHGARGLLRAASGARRHLLRVARLGLGARLGLERLVGP